MGDFAQLNAALQRIRRMEARMDGIRRALEEAPERLQEDESFRKEICALIHYYEGGEWLEDYARDERGELPAGLKRGVLSEDAVYDLLQELRRLTGPEPWQCGENESPER